MQSSQTRRWQPDLAARRHKCRELFDLHALRWFTEIEMPSQAYVKWHHGDEYTRSWPTTSSVPAHVEVFRVACPDTSGTAYPRSHIVSPLLGVHNQAEPCG